MRQILSLQESSNDEDISAAVISRKTGSWWRQIILNKGSKDGVEIGNVVIGPGGLLGRVKNTSLFTLFQSRFGLVNFKKKLFLRALTKNL